MATAFVVIVLVTALIVKDLRRVSKHDTSEGMDVRRGFVLRKCSIFQGSLMKVLPLTAIKTVVVVWQIVYQVRRGSCHKSMFLCWCSYVYADSHGS